jgi:hypothetical protein
MIFPLEIPCSSLWVLSSHYFKIWQNCKPQTWGCWIYHYQPWLTLWYYMIFLLYSILPINPLKIQYINHYQASLTIIHHDIPIIFPWYSYDFPTSPSGLARRGSGRSGHAGFLSGADLSVQFLGRSSLRLGVCRWGYSYGYSSMVNSTPWAGIQPLGNPCGKQTVCELEAIAIEIVDLPSYNMVIFHSYVNVYQRVTILIYQLMTGTALPSRETCAVTLQ